MSFQFSHDSNSAEQTQLLGSIRQPRIGNNSRNKSHVVFKFGDNLNYAHGKQHSYSYFNYNYKFIYHIFLI